MGVPSMPATMRSVLSSTSFSVVASLLRLPVRMAACKHLKSLAAGCAPNEVHCSMWQLMIVNKNAPLMHMSCKSEAHDTLSFAIENGVQQWHTGMKCRGLFALPAAGVPRCMQAACASAVESCKASTPR